MRIARLSAENFKRLTAVEIAPDGNVVEIRGRNQAGKSSVLDAIWAALGGADGIPGKPIRKGAETARIELDLGEIIVTRKFGPGDRTSVVVAAASGARFPSPQHMLDQLIGAIAFDPLEFTRMKPKDQLQNLRGLVNLAVDIDALDGLNQADYERRTEVNREIAKLRGQASGIFYPEDLPADPINVEALTRALAQAGEDNATITVRRERRERTVERIADLRAEADEIASGIEGRIANLKHDAELETGRFDRRIAEMERQLAALRDERNEHAAAGAAAVDARRRSLEADAADRRGQAEELYARMEQAEPLPEPVDTGELLRGLNEARTINAAIEARTRRKTLEAEADALDRRAAGLTEAIEGRRAAKTKAISEAKMPVPGLSFGDGEVLLNDIPFAQVSASEQIRVSVAIAMAANPRLKVLCVRDGSLLDRDSMAALAEAVTAHDYQLWIERVGTEDGVGIIIEDGSVAARHQRTAEPAPAQASLV